MEIDPCRDSASNIFNPLWNE